MKKKKEQSIWNSIPASLSMGVCLNKTMPTSRTTGRHPDSMDVFSHKPSQMTIGHINTCPYCHALYKESFTERQMYL